jgi:hypothetical protein
MGQIMMSNEELLCTIKLPYGNLRQITGKLPKANYGNGMRRNSSMPTCSLVKSARQNINLNIPPLNELKMERRSRQNSRYSHIPTAV